MTALADLAARKVQGRPGLWVALALSVTLNVFLVGGIVWGMMAYEPLRTPAERFVAVGRSMQLDQPQRAALATFAATARDATLALRQSNAPVMQKIWSELAKPNPDESAIASLTGEALAHRRSYQDTMTAGLIKFLATLSPEQRSQFTALVHRPHPEPRHGFHLGGL